jgi:hypothetical protein
MALVRFRLASSGGEEAYINPDMVVCLMKAGNQRTQVVTSGLTGESSISLIVALDIDEAAECLGVAASRLEPAAA